MPYYVVQAGLKPTNAFQVTRFRLWACGPLPTFNLQWWPYQLFEVGIPLTSLPLWPGAALRQSLYFQHLLNDLKVGSKRRQEQMYSVITIAGLAQAQGSTHRKPGNAFKYGVGS